jgi:hypothetical protein
MSARAQGLGVLHPDVEPTTTVTPRTILAGEVGTFYACAVNHVLNVCWMLDDVFAGKGAKDIAAGDRDAVMTLAMRVFLEAIEVGQMAHQFPRWR